MARTVQDPKHPDSRAVKPEPAPNIYQLMEEDLRVLAAEAKNKPLKPGEFTRQSFMAATGCTDGQFENRIVKLLRAGKVKKLGSTGRNVFYKYVQEE